MMFPKLDLILMDFSQLNVIFQKSKHCILNVKASERTTFMQMFGKYCQNILRRTLVMSWGTVRLSV